MVLVGVSPRDHGPDVDRVHVVSVACVGRVEPHQDPMKYETNPAAASLLDSSDIPAERGLVRADAGLRGACR